MWLPLGEVWFDNYMYMLWTRVLAFNQTKIRQWRKYESITRTLIHVKSPRVLVLQLLSALACHVTILPTMVKRPCGWEFLAKHSNGNGTPLLATLQYPNNNSSRCGRHARWRSHKCFTQGDPHGGSKWSARISTMRNRWPEPTVEVKWQCFRHALSVCWEVYG